MTHDSETWLYCEYRLIGGVARVFGRYEGPYHIICKRLLGQAPLEIREELSKVVAVVLDR